MVLAGANAWYLWRAHWEHWDHMPPLEERTEYPYQNIRSKNYQWGDGDKVSDRVYVVDCELMMADKSVDSVVSTDVHGAQTERWELAMGCCPGLETRDAND